MGAKSKNKRRTAKTVAVDAAPVVQLNLPPPFKVTESMLARSKQKARDGQIPVIFKMPELPPRVLPKGIDQKTILANDELVIEANAWAAQQVYNGAYFNGVTFLGYQTLAILAQSPEYRRVSEVLATEATRKWIKFQSTSNGKKSKAGKIAELTKECARLDIQGAFRKMIELDGFFGRAHLYVDTGSTEDRGELVTPIGDGTDVVSKNKFAGRKGFLKALRPVEPVWCYPAKYNANDPLRDDWYNPQSWFCQGKEIHSSRLLTFVGREVPDLLKPSYSFGGLSLSQMAKPYIDNWLRTRQAVADLIWSFSVRGLKTDLSTVLAEDGQQLFNRAALFANMQTNQGLMMLNKDTEDFFNIVTPLGTLDALQAQSQEHICSVTGTPVVKLLGIQPAGLNASSEGELTVWYDWVEAFQEKFITRRLNQVLAFVQLSLWGEADPDITWTFKSLRALTDLELATKRDQEADTDTKLIDAGVLAPLDVRKRLASDPESPYDGLDVDDLTETGGEFDEEDGGSPDLGSLVGQLGATTPRDPDREERVRGRTEEPRVDRSRSEPRREDRTRVREQV